jgi:membrane protease YdiL (CAAX protease family)
MKQRDIIKDTVEKFIVYLKNPTEDQEVDAPIEVKVKTLVHLFLFSLLAIYGYSILLAIIERFHWIDSGVNNNSTIVFRYSYLKMILIGVVIAPILEELIFRLPLRYKYNYIIRLTANLLAKMKHNDPKAYEEKAQTFWTKNFRYFFYIMLLLFGCAHFFNYSNYDKLWTWIIVLVFPQIIIGSILGYIRVRFSLPWSMIYHAFHNFVFFSIAFLQFSTLANYETKNRDYSFSMHKGSEEIRGANEFQVVPGKVVFENYKLTDVMEVVLARPGKYFLNNTYGDMFVTIHYLKKGVHENTAASLKMVSYNIRKAMKARLKRQMVQKEVWELYVCDSIMYRKAVLPFLPNEKHCSLRSIGKFLDSQNKDCYILSNDTVHQFCLNLNLKRPSFEGIRNSWAKKYGLGFRKVQWKLEFINFK